MGTQTVHIPATTSDRVFYTQTRPYKCVFDENPLEFLKVQWNERNAMCETIFRWVLLLRDKGELLVSFERQ